MQVDVAHKDMRRELLAWLSDGMSDDTELSGLHSFLADDFPYSAEYVFGLVLREHELQPWQELMAAVEATSPSLSVKDIGPFRKLAGKLLAEMRK